MLLSLVLFTFLIFSTELLMTLSSDILSKGNLPFSFPLYGLSLKEPPLMEILGRKHFLFFVIISLLPSSLLLSPYNEGHISSTSDHALITSPGEHKHSQRQRFAKQITTSFMNSG